MNTMTIKVWPLILPLLAGGTPMAADTQTAVPSPPTAMTRRLEWWRDARFGMFIHWGPVSLKGTEIGWSRGSNIPIAEYDSLYRQFNPTNFNARQWARVAKAAGMKYMVFTTKHHDGFCMFETKQTDFNIMQSPFARDVTKELAAACRKEGLRFGTYHSVCDWHHPDFPLTSPGGKVKRETSNLDRYERYLHAQVKELIQNYGPLQTMWFDVPQQFDRERGLKLEAWTRSLQPDITINNRSGASGDYDTPEQRVGNFQDQRPWETCMTIANQWAWRPNDPMKSLKQCLQTLVLCAGGDGNLLFNVGPTPDGRIEPRQVERLREIGAWLSKYGDTLYRTRGGPWKPTKTLASTRRGKTVFLHVLRWNGDSISLPPLPAKIRRARLLTGGKVEFWQGIDGVTLTVAPRDQQEVDTIVRLDLDRPAMELRPVGFPSTLKATASNVFQGMEAYAADCAFDDDPQSRWATDGGTKQAWVALDLGKPTLIRSVSISEALAPRVQKFGFEYRDKGEWKTIFSGTQLGADFKQGFTPVVTQEVRLNVLDASDGPTIWDIKINP
jgi:alpha-L-fucosidase